MKESRKEFIKKAHSAACSEWKENIEKEVLTADLVIGAVLIPGGKAPNLVSEAVIKKMKKGSVVIDVAVDQGGCIETSEVTTHDDPIIQKHGVLHYGVANMPGSVPQTSTQALVNTTLPFVKKIANLGFLDAIRDGKSSPIPYNELIESSRIAIEIANSLRKP